jgi:multidrug transporter EmrE-like cation transporter
MLWTTRDATFWAGSAFALLGVIGAVVFDVFQYRPRWAIASIGLVVVGIAVVVLRHQHRGHQG